jgi:hypothetical protein
MRWRPIRGWLIRGGWLKSNWLASYLAGLLSLAGFGLACCRWDIYAPDSTQGQEKTNEII